MIGAYDRIKAARAKGRPTAQKYIEQIFKEFTPLHGDRLFAEDAAVLGGIGWLRDMPVTVVATEKGVDTRERVQRNFGEPSPEGYRKTLRLMRQAEKFRRPVLCIVDTAGAWCGMDAEERGQGEAIARNLMEMMTLKTPILSLFIGEGGSGGALALAVADQVWMLENACYSVISPEGCASILWKDGKKSKEASESLRLTAQDMLDLHVADRVFPEPEAKDFPKFCRQLETAIWQFFQAQQEKGAYELTSARYRRFRQFGAEEYCNANDIVR